MMDYLVPAEDAVTEFTEKRSRFISHLWVVETEEEAQDYVKSMKKKYHDATHNCWCYIIKEGGVLRYADDGEPQGTAGMPMLEVFRREEVFNVCCVVTRYFGGILLGAGGLTRAYSRGAKDALNVAGISRMQLWSQVDIPCEYHLFERVKLEVENASGLIADIEYGADVIVHGLFPQEKVTQLQEKLTELSAGAIQIVHLEDVFRGGKREEAK